MGIIEDGSVMGGPPKSIVSDVIKGDYQNLGLPSFSVAQKGKFYEDKNTGQVAELSQNGTDWDLYHPTIFSWSQLNDGLVEGESLQYEDPSGNRADFRWDGSDWILQGAVSGPCEIWPMTGQSGFLGASTNNDVGNPDYSILTGSNQLEFQCTDDGQHDLLARSAPFLVGPGVTVRMTDAKLNGIDVGDTDKPISISLDITDYNKTNTDDPVVDTGLIVDTESISDEIVRGVYTEPDGTVVLASDNNAVIDPTHKFEIEVAFGGMKAGSGNSWAVPFARIADLDAMGTVLDGMQDSFRVASSVRAGELGIQIGETTANASATSNIYFGPIEVE